MASILKPEEVRLYLSDFPEANLLLDAEDFSDPYIVLSMELAADEYNALPPRSNLTPDNFVSKSLLLQGTLWKMFAGKSALAARNTMNYSDGGLVIPIEEKFELYMGLANTFKQEFIDAATKLKISLNMESGWGIVRSDESNFPLW